MNNIYIRLATEKLLKFVTSIVIEDAVRVDLQTARNPGAGLQ